jgi:hypothetical protein
MGDQQQGDCFMAKPFSVIPILARLGIVPPRAVTIWAIRIYQKHFSRHTKTCGRHPGCSQRGIEAVRTYGSRDGLIRVIEGKS